MSGELPRERILPQVTSRFGWDSDREKDVKALCEFVVAKYPEADAQQLAHRLRPLLAKAAALLAVGKPKGQKPATVIRDQLEEIRKLPAESALEAVLALDLVAVEYLDLRLESEDRDFDGSRPDDTRERQIELARKRYELILTGGEDLIPLAQRGTENPWSYVAELVAELLHDVTGKEPKRSWNAHTEEDSGWPLMFFRKFAVMVVGPSTPPRLDKVWRNALDARAERSETTASEPNAHREK